MRTGTLEDALLEELQAISRQLVGLTASALARVRADVGISISLPQYRVLVLLASNTARRPSELAQDLKVTRPAIAQIVGPLEAARLISRRSDRGDRRSSMLSLTAKGARIVRVVLRARERALGPVVNRLPERDRRALAASLPRLHRALSATQGTDDAET